MEKIKHKKIPHSKKERIGIPTNLLNCEGDEILTGDHIHLKGTDYEGPVMWNRHQDMFGIFMGCWYYDRDQYNPDCYGKFIGIKNDNGMRMELIPISRGE